MDALPNFQGTDITYQQTQISDNQLAEMFRVRHESGDLGRSQSKASVVSTDDHHLAFNGR